MALITLTMMTVLCLSILTVRPAILSQNEIRHPVREIDSCQCKFQ